MTMKTNPVAYTPDELYAQASKLAEDWNLPEKWREDAVQEFVVAATEAVASANRFVRAHQHRCGRSAMSKFVRREERAEGRRPMDCLPGAKRVSLDMHVPGMEGDPTTLAETIVDRSTPAPDAGLNTADLKKTVAHAMTRLTPEEIGVARRVYIDGDTQTAAGEALGLTRDQIRSRLASALPILRVWLAEYRALAGE